MKNQTTKWIPSDSYLQKEFSKYNRIFFGNQLPRALVRWGRLRNQRAAQITFYDDDSVDITIRPGFRTMGAESICCMLLLHEMCHLSQWVKNKDEISHGKEFQKEMKRLVKMGAFDTLW